MVRTYTRDEYQHYIVLTLMCGCRTSVPASSIFEMSSDYVECPWNDKAHGQQRWVSFDGMPDKVAPFTFKCTRRGCSVKQKGYVTFALMRSSGKSHSRVNGHTVRLFAGSWQGEEIEPALLDEGIPY